MSTEYMFFYEDLRLRFAAFAAAHGLTSTTAPDSIEGWVVTLHDELDDAQLALVNAEYDQLLDEQRALADTEDGADAKDLMGVTVQLPGQEAFVVRIPAEHGRRLIEHFTFEEIHALVSSIAQQSISPVRGPLCRAL
jgi:hypothetical protein